jgi:hypothetical protein
MLLERVIVVDMGTRYRMEGPGDRNPVGVKLSSLVQIGPRAHPSSYTIGTGSLLKRQNGRGVVLTPQPI